MAVVSTTLRELVSVLVEEPTIVEDTSDAEREFVSLAVISVTMASELESDTLSDGDSLALNALVVAVASVTLAAGDSVPLNALVIAVVSVTLTVGASVPSKALVVNVVSVTLSDGASEPVLDTLPVSTTLDSETDNEFVSVLVDEPTIVDDTSATDSAGVSLPVTSVVITRTLASDTDSAALS